MKLLTLDFLRRWWWALAVFAVVTLVTTVNASPIVLGPAALVSLLFDATRGVFRAVRPQPVALREQAQTWWLLAVWLVPIVSLVPIVLGTLIYLGMNGVTQVAMPMLHEVGGKFIARPEMPSFVTTYSPWFAAAVQIWVGLGFAALCFLLACGLPTRPPEGVWESLTAIVVGALWGFSIPGLTFVLPLMPQTPAGVHGWHWAVFVSVPFFVVISYLVAPDLMRRRTLVVAAVRPRRGASAQAGSRGGLTGASLYLATFPLRAALMIVAIAVVQYFFVRLMTGGAGSPPGPLPRQYMPLMQIAMFAIIFGAISAEWSNMRSLRTLPLSRERLAALLLAIPVGNGLVAALMATFFVGDGAANLHTIFAFTAQVIYCAGFGGLALVGMLHISSGLRLLMLMAAIIPASGFAFAATLPLVFAPLGALALLAAWLLLIRGIGKSAAFYRPRSFFGVNIGQPMAVR